MPVDTAAAITDTIAWFKAMPSADDLQLVVERLSVENGEISDTEWTPERLKSTLIEAREGLGRATLFRMLAEIEELDVELDEPFTDEPITEAETVDYLPEESLPKPTQKQQRSNSRKNASKENSASTKNGAATKKPRAAKATA